MTWIVRLIFLAVILSMLYILLPESRLKSVLGGIMGLILLLHLIQPIGQFLRGNTWTNIGDVVLEDIQSTEGQEQDAVILKYKEKCAEAIDAYTLALEGVSSCRAEVIVDENRDEDTFASLQHVYLYVTLGADQKTESWISPIVILPPSKSEDGEKKEKINAIQSSVAAWLQIDKSCVTVFEEGL